MNITTCQKDETRKCGYCSYKYRHKLLIQTFSLTWLTVSHEEFGLILGVYLGLRFSLAIHPSDQRHPYWRLVRTKSWQAMTQPYPSCLCSSCSCLLSMITPKNTCYNSYEAKKYNDKRNMFYSLQHWSTNLISIAYSVQFMPGVPWVIPIKLDHC